MKRAGLALGLGLILMLAVGSAADQVPAGWLPDPVLPVVVALGLQLGGLHGLVAAWALGWAGDLLSGAPLGQGAFAALCAWALTRASQGRIALSRSAVLASYVFVLCVVEAAAVAALRPPPLALPSLGLLLPHALLSALLAPLVRRVYDAGIGRLDPAEAALRGSLHFEPGPPR